MKWRCVLLLALYQLAAVGAKFSLNNIDKCMQSLSADKGSALEKKGRQMFLYFGDAGIEAMSVLSEHDRKRINLLVKCTQAEDNSLFEDRTGSTSHFHDGGSNVTYLTGIFQSLMPDLDKTLKDIANKAVQHAEWSGDVTAMGIRSVQHLSFYKAGLKAYREEKKRRTLEKNDKDAFIIYPDHETREKQRLHSERLARTKMDPDADEVVSAYLAPVEPPGAVAYTAVILLSDRGQFAGAEVLITKKKTARTTINLHPTTGSGGTHSGSSNNENSADEEDMGYDDEDTDEQDSNAGESTDSIAEHKEKQRRQLEEDLADGLPSFPQFSAGTTGISRYTPEPGSLLLLHGEHQRGLRPVLFGRRHCLVVEYWMYADAPVGAKRPALSEAQPLPGKNMNKDEL